MSKRQAEKSVGKHGGNASKKVKADGRDIPSSNFAAIKSKPAPKYSQITQAQITSVPKTGPNLQNPTQLLRKMNLPGVYQEAMGVDVLQLAKYEKEKKKREEERKKLEKSRPPSERKQPEKMEEEYKPKKIIQDESGRIVDEEGNVIHQKPANTSSLKVNINKDKEQRVKQILNLQKGTNRNSKFFDPTLLAKSQGLRNRRKNNAFHFIEKGSITAKGEALRGHTDNVLGSAPGTSETPAENDTLGKLQQKLAAAPEVQVGIKRTTVRVKRHDPIPDIEWWDAPLMPRRSYLPEENLVLEKESMKEKYDGEKKADENATEQQQKGEEKGDSNQASLIERLNKNLELLLDNSVLDSSLFKDKINNMIEHPATFKTEGAGQNPIMPVYLTKDERKKLRRKRRLEREKDKQEKIRLGLIKPPPAKVKYSNFMNIMKDEAVADPTRIEMEVRKATQERLQAHLDRNAKKKLTKEQKAEKHMRKLRRDSALECRVAVFRIEDLSHGAHKFKVNMNAQQLALNGVCIIADRRLGLNLPNVVVVEGGPKAIKFYKKLMLRRIKWTLKSQKETGEAEGEKPANAFNVENKCTLVWEGILKDHNFNKWRVAEIKSELEGRRLLSDRGVEFYWDRALTSSAVEDEED